MSLKRLKTGFQSSIWFKLTEDMVDVNSMTIVFEVVDDVGGLASNRTELVDFTLRLEGGPDLRDVDREPPYSLYGEDSSGNLIGGSLQRGEYTLLIEPSGPGTGIFEERQVNFVIMSARVSGFALIDAEKRYCSHRGSNSRSSFEFVNSALGN